MRVLVISEPVRVLVMSASSELRRVLVALNTRTGYEQTVAKLLELGADPFAVNDIGLTALLNAEGNWAGSAPPSLGSVSLVSTD